ncbi:uncharacterized protein LOC119109919 [Pollicipes pollicipes]|uniref:uncharacterized protein LOC119109919 n=1 Tax=Pollicipes pollicipes TaxID=41117 RepID=UPI0018859202|nr:uncharacterized protein LOC119109919 [Pollicipes pollicipes]
MTHTRTHQAGQHAAPPPDGRKRPFKVWDHRRHTKKGLVAASLGELLTRGREKLKYDVSRGVSAVLESDGTTVDDTEYFATLPDNTVFLLLRDSDRWLPPGVDMLRAALTCIPRIVCQTMHALDLRDEAPSWKIADNRGQVTVQLHWDSAAGGERSERRAHLVVRGVGEGSSVESGTVHVHTAECGAHHPHVHHHHATRGSPADQCDFHCCALHRGGAPTTATKSAATSPIQEAASGRRPLTHARFDEVARAETAAAAAAKGATAEESSESEGDNTVNEEGTSQKLLLLVDQLSVERTRYLSIKDIGIILERLSSKILDVERMEREKDGDDCHNWTLKATIRGDVLRDIGVVYHGHYHSISEHPRYARWRAQAAHLALRAIPGFDGD